MSERFYVYSKPNCSFCNKAITLLSDEDKTFNVFTLDVDFTRDQLLEKFPDAKTFPQIIVENSGHITYIGGFTQLEKYIDG